MKLRFACAILVRAPATLRGSCSIVVRGTAPSIDCRVAPITIALKPFDVPTSSTRFLLLLRSKIWISSAVDRSRLSIFFFRSVWTGSCERPKRSISSSTRVTLGLKFRLIDFFSQLESPWVDENLTQRPARNASCRSVHAATQKLARSDAGGRQDAKISDFTERICGMVSPLVIPKVTRALPFTLAALDVLAHVEQRLQWLPPAQLHLI